MWLGSDLYNYKVYKGSNTILGLFMFSAIKSGVVLSSKILQFDRSFLLFYSILACSLQKEGFEFCASFTSFNFLEIQCLNQLCNDEKGLDFYFLVLCLCIVVLDLT